jgi:branched-chain amino acid transport system permease protein
MKRPSGTFDESYSQDMALVRTPFRWALLALLFLCLFVVIPGFTSAYILSVANTIGITVIATLGLNILTGYCGQISIGHAAFMAVGAYVSAMLSYHLGWSFWAAFPVAVLATGLIGLLVGLPALRIKGFYIAVSTLAAHYIIVWLIIHGGWLTRGVNAIEAAAPTVFGFTLKTERDMYFFIMGFTVLAVFLAVNLVRTRVGRAFVAVRDNDLAAEFMGINVFHYKMLAFLMASFYAGAAGSLLAHYQGMISVEQFNLMDSIWYLGMLIVGGMGSVTGAIFGAVSLRLLAQAVLFLAPVIGGLFPAIAGSSVAGMTQVFFGLVIILFLIFEPRGLFHRWQLILASFRLWPFPY